MIRKARCPTVAWNTSKVAFQSVSRAAIDAKRTQLQAVVFSNEERTVEFSSSTLGLVTESDNAGSAVSEAERKRVLLRGMPWDHGMTVEVIMSLLHTYGEAVSTLIVRESRF